MIFYTFSSHIASLVINNIRPTISVVEIPSVLLNILYLNEYVSYFILLASLKG